MSEVNFELALTSIKKPFSLSIRFNLNKESMRDKKMLQDFIRSAIKNGLEAGAWSTPDEEVLGIEISLPFKKSMFGKNIKPIILHSFKQKNVRSGCRMENS